MSLFSVSDPATCTTDPSLPSSSSQNEVNVDHFDQLPDSILLLVFNRIGDVKALGRCSAVSRRFSSLVAQVDNVHVRVDCVISDSDDTNPSAVSSTTVVSSDKPRGLISQFAHLVLGGIIRPIQLLTGQILGPKKQDDSSAADSLTSEVSHHSPAEVLKNFTEIRRLQIELPSGELGTENGVLLKWKADFGSTLHYCVILGASTIAVAPDTASDASLSSSKTTLDETVGAEGPEEDNGGIPESFYTNGSLKLRVVWTISCLIAASARHYLLQPIVANHSTLENLELTDADGQGKLSMDRRQLEELMVKPLSASGSSQRTLVPALNMRLWYAPHLELPGLILKGATLVAIQPREQPGESNLRLDGECISSAFEGHYGTAARLLLKRRIYCLEMNSF